MKKLSRRRFLVGASGVTLSLPIAIEALRPRHANAATMPLRFGALYFPHGTPPGAWSPQNVDEGPNYALAPMTMALAPHKAQLMPVINATIPGDSQHPGHCAGFLTGRFPPDHASAPWRARGKSADQLIADTIADQGQTHSLVMSPPGEGPEHGGQSGTYGSHMSWASETAPVPRETNPRVLFDRILAGVTEPPSGGENMDLAQARADKRSILDFVLSDARRLQARLGPSDRRLLDAYMTEVRAIETRLSTTTDTPPPTAVCDGERPPEGEFEHSADLDLKIDLMALAFRCDVTRVSTLVLDWECSGRSYSFLDGVSARPYHGISHDNDADSEELRRITEFMFEKYARLLTKLAEVDEEGGSALDNSLLLMGSGMSNGDRLHGKANLPLFLAGGAGGALTTGRVLDAADGSRDGEVGDLLYSILRTMGVEEPFFGHERLLF